MSRKRRKYGIPSPGVVRVFAVALLTIDLALIGVLVGNYSNLDWIGHVLLISTVASMYFPLMALKTGDPEWVLLDLILPS